MVFKADYYHQCNCFTLVQHQSFVSEAKKFESSVTIKNVDKDSAQLTLESIMMILAAGLGTGTKIEIACDGMTSEQLLTSCRSR